ncbi:SDR family oxidoreductase [Terrimonas alba]|uniref:SDR family oxidoreductase n=1 Tax=Terrimonas alba TaxID=3349636 RepID=UPI0035F39336
MNILITGANGFLGYYLVQQLLEAGFNVIASGKGECRLPFTDKDNFTYVQMDFTDPYRVHDVFENFHPEIVVHAGAMSKPDECELQQWQAYLVNVEGTVNVLMNAAEWKSFFVFISTDFVFNGEKGMYTEEDSPAPVNYYGKTKQEGEEAVREYEFDWAIVRTVLVYGKPAFNRSNILTIVKEKLEKGETYNVVDDQIRTPTYVEDLARGIVQIIQKKATGIFHLSGKDIMTPYQMACRAADHLGLDKNLITRVTATHFTQPARRPPKTGFIIDKAKTQLGFDPISFDEGLKKTFA